MDTLSYKTVSAKPKEVTKDWYVIDASSEIVGRLSSRVAMVLRGKHKPSYTPHVDCGDKVIIINADKVQFTGNKWADKEYVRYTGHPGGQRFTAAKVLLQKYPVRILEKSVRGMLPKNRLGDKIIRNLYVYAGTDHPHTGQNPKPLTF